MEKDIPVNKIQEKVRVANVIHTQIDLKIIYTNQKQEIH